MVCRRQTEHAKSGCKTLHEIEQGGNETAAIAELISTAVLRRHLETMARLDIEYDFLPRESEILHLHFWDAAFAKLKDAGVLFFENDGKNKGCWVMRRGNSILPPRSQTPPRTAKTKIRKIRKSSFAPTALSDMSAKTSLITCGSLDCWARISDIASFISIPTSTSAGFPPRSARRTILILATSPKFIT